jgi:hypothetical protein
MHGTIRRERSESTGAIGDCDPDLQEVLARGQTDPPNEA